MKTRITRRLRLYVFIITFITVFSMTFVIAAAKPSNTVFYPVETDEVLNNPYMGWAPWASGGPYQQPHRLVYINVSWTDLEPEKGKYDFKSLEKENKFSYWRSKGVKIILRINMDYPGSQPHMDIPRWLYNEIKGDGTKYDIAYGKGFSPNYNNPTLIAYHEKLINALAARYNNDGLIAMVALGSLGHWGEFHTWRSRNFTIPFPKEKISDIYVSHYVKTFTNKILLMRRPFGIAANNGMGLYNDSFGDIRQTYDYFLDYITGGYTDSLTGEKHPAMPDYWKTAPSGGEFARYPGLEFFRNDKMERTLQEVKDSHVSWLGPSSPGNQSPKSSLQKNFDLVLKTMGYRFVLKSVTHPRFIANVQSFSVDMEWENKGVAPFYYRWPLELSLSDRNGKIVASTLTSADIRTWLPGKIKVSHKFSLPKDITGGVYTLCAAIIDPSTGKPGIDLAIGGRRTDGRYALDRVYILKLLQ